MSLSGSNPGTRRDFLSQVGGASAVLLAGQVISQETSVENDKPLVVGVMGLSRGRELAREFSTNRNVSVKYLCDTDRDRMDAAVKDWKGGNQPEGTQDWRRILDDPQVDILVCAAPNHWHAPATILACAAGKHVYVEKPCSHNPQEGEWMVAAAKKHRRCVQVGTQRRSSQSTREAIKKLHDGVIGRVYLARAYYNSARGPLGSVEPAQVPPHLDYANWQGPAPMQPYRSNVIHYNWHWFWHWGGGELANNGVHVLDLCRWGLQVDYPIASSSVGGRYAFDDDQETPDTQTVAWDFADRKQISWQGLSCNPHGNSFVEFFGEAGAMALDANGGYVVFDLKDKRLEEVKGSGAGQAEHVTNFLQAVRREEPAMLHCGIEEAHRSTLLCHLGNISQRLSRRIHSDPVNGRIPDEPDAKQLWQRDYADGWLKDLTTAST